MIEKTIMPRHVAAAGYDCTNLDDADKAGASHGADAWYWMRFFMYPISVWKKTKLNRKHTVRKLRLIIYKHGYSLCYESVIRAHVLCACLGT